MDRAFCRSLHLILALLPFVSIAQTYLSPLKQKWVLKHPFEQKVFIENNEGQFDNKIKDGYKKVLFSTHIGKLTLYFTTSGLTYRYDKVEKSTPEEIKEREKNVKEDDHTQTKIDSIFFNVAWKNPNHNTEVIAEDEVSFYYTYLVNNKHTIIAHAFKKLLYKNIYNGIDVEYSFPNDTIGIEYSLIVHPGANLSQAILSYPDARSIIDSSGNINLQCDLGTFIDNAPAKTYYTENGDPIKSSFRLKNNEVSFYCSNYNKAKTLVIDPWTTNPNFAWFNAAYDVDFDLAGNIYASGGGNISVYGPYQLIKINPTGAIQWVFNTGPNKETYGSLCVDRKNSISYFSTIFTVYKITPNGTTLLSNSGPSGSEFWRMNYDECNDNIIVGSGNPNNTYQAGFMGTNIGFNPVNVLNENQTNFDMALLATDENNGYCYMATMIPIWGYSGPNNVLLKCPIPSLLPTVFMVNDGFSFHELESVYYVDDTRYATNGFNGLAVSPNWLYGYDGSVLKRFDKNSGNLINSVNVTNTSFKWAGLAVDNCENIYVGNKNFINIYDSSMNAISSFGMSSYVDTVYDIKLGTNNLLYACGKDFVSVYDISNPSLSLTKVSSPACSGCNGTALALVTGCNAQQVNYKWSNGSTSQLATGLCAGTYSVTVSNGCVPIFTDTVNVSSTTNPSVSIPATTVTNESCYNYSNGSATAIVTGGTAPYTYYWVPSNQTTQTAITLSVGSYTVISKDSNGCAGISTINITQPTLLTTKSAGDTSINIGGSASISATSSGGTPSYTYLWDSAFQGSTISVSPLVNTTYTVITTDSDGCTSAAYVTVDVICGHLFIPEAFSPNNDGQNDKLYVRDDCIKTMDFMIFDRWGNKVFETTDQSVPWDGNYKGKPMNTGPYVYYLSATMYDGTTVNKKGDVTLVR